MKQTKIGGYEPKYPKKLLKGAALTAAAILAVGAAGCRTIQREPDIAGMIDVIEPTEEAVRTDGEVMIDEPTDEPTEAPVCTPDPDEELVLSGDVMYMEPTEP